MKSVILNIYIFLNTILAMYIYKSYLIKIDEKDVMWGISLYICSAIILSCLYIYISKKVEK